MKMYISERTQLELNPLSEVFQRWHMQCLPFALYTKKSCPKIVSGILLKDIMITFLKGQVCSLGTLNSREQCKSNHM